MTSAYLELVVCDNEQAMMRRQAITQLLAKLGSIFPLLWQIGSKLGMFLRPTNSNTYRDQPVQLPCMHAQYGLQATVLYIGSCFPDVTSKPLQTLDFVESRVVERQLPYTRKLQTRLFPAYLRTICIEPLLRGQRLLSLGAIKSTEP